MILDKIDKAILKQLQQDAKLSNKQLSNMLGLSVTAVYERIKKLERNGLIMKYVALVDKTKVDLGLTVFCHIKLSQHLQQPITDFERQVVKLDEVVECFHVSGDYDYLLKVVVKDVGHYRNFMVTKLTTLDHIGSTQSSFTINEVKNTTEVIF